MKKITLEDWIKNPFQTLKTITLPNGITIHAVTGPFSEYARVNFLFPTGSYLDGDRQGLSHFVEHTIFDENESILWNLRQRHHIHLEAYTNDTHNWYGLRGYREFESFSENGKYFSSFSDLFEEVKDILFGESTITQETITKQRDIITQEFLQHFPFGSEEYLKKKQTLPEMVFHPLGPLESIQSISLSDVQSFKRSYYRPENCTVLFIGPQSMLDQIINSLEIIPIGKGSKPITIPVLENFFSVGQEWTTSDWGFNKNSNLIVSNQILYKYKNSESILTILNPWIQAEMLEELRQNQKIVYLLGSEKKQNQLWDTLMFEASVPSLGLGKTQDYFDYFFSKVRMNQKDFDVLKKKHIRNLENPNIIDEFDLLSDMRLWVIEENKIVTFQEVYSRLSEVTLQDVNDFLDFFAQKRIKRVISL